MKNIGNLMKQVQDMQSRMEEATERLSSVEIPGSAGGGMVTVVVNGLGDARKVAIDPALLGDPDASVIEDLVLAAFNDATAKSRNHRNEEMSKVTGGLQVPGLTLPF